MRVCVLAAEAGPYATEGGLADVVAALSSALVQAGVEIKVFIPLYKRVAELSYIRKLADLPAVRMGGSERPVSLWVDSRQQPSRNYFIGNREYFDRDGIYNDPSSGEGYEDNFERFNLFTLAALGALEYLQWKPHVIHCNDSQTALAPAYLKLERMGESFYKGISTVLTIHNLAYQGLYPESCFRLTGLPQELFYPTGPFEYYGQLNLLKAGICYADVLNTVSPQYAKEIQTTEYGAGLESVLRMRKEDLYGILNGIDTEEWNPRTDPLIFARFSAEDLQGKRLNKEGLQDLCGFAVRDVPLVGMISRLADQKGLDLFLEIKPEVNRLDCQWVILGTGLKRYQVALEALARENPEKFSVYLEFDNVLAHRIEAGSDIFLMPSRYEPCGLNQMYSMRYGTIPVVRHTGGLADTVRDFVQHPDSATGFKFYEYDAEELLKVIKRAIETWKDRETWGNLVRNVMAQDFSWECSARKYVELFQKAINHP